MYPKAAGLKEEKIVDGKEVLHGVILRSEGSPFRKLRVFSSLTTVLQELVHQHAAQLRPGQGQEAWQDHVEDTLRAFPKTMRAPATAPTMGHVKELVQKAKDTESQTADAALACESVQAGAELEQPKEASRQEDGILNLDTSDSESEKSENGVKAAQPLFGRIANPKTAKQKKRKAAAKASSSSLVSQAKAKPKKGAKSIVGPQTDDIRPEDSASQAPSAKRRKTWMDDANPALPTEVASAVSVASDEARSVLKWKKECCINTILSGKLLKNDRYQLKRAIKKLKDEEPLSPIIFVGQAHLDVVENAHALVEGFKSLPAKNRKDIIERLVRAEVSWPVTMQHRLLVEAVKDCVTDR